MLAKSIIRSNSAIQEFASQQKELSTIVSNLTQPLQAALAIQHIAPLGKEVQKLVTTPRAQAAGLLGTSPSPVVPGQEYSRMH
jgi:hypothetical protein